MITAVVSKKGGVGKTTTAVNLAAALAMGGYKVLLVDLDPSAGASLSLGTAKRDLIPGTADLLRGVEDLEPLLRDTKVPRLRVMPASIDLRGIEHELNQLPRRQDNTLARAIDKLRGDFHWIFIDCPASLGVLTRNALVASDGYLIPSAPHFLALEGLEQVVATVDRLSYNNLTRSHLLGIVLTMVDFRVRTTRMKLDEIRERFGSQVFGVEIRTNVDLAEAPAFGQTIFEYQPRATGALAYSLVAEEFLLRWGQIERQREEVESARSV